MSRLPYPVMTLQKDVRIQTPVSTSWRLFLHLADTENYKTQFERITIYTCVREPSDPHPQALEIAALRRVHALLGEQIVALQCQQDQPNPTPFHP